MVLPRAPKGHYAAVTKSNDIPALVKAINAIGSPQSRAAILFCLYTALRPGVVVGVRWDEFDLNAMEWHTGFPVKWKKRPVKPGEYPFVTEEDQAWWAEPDIADAVRQMEAARAAAKDTQFAKRVKSFAEKQFSLERIGALMKQRLEEIATTVLSKPC